MSDYTKYEIAKCYGIGLSVDQTSVITELSVEEIAIIVKSDYALRQSMKEQRERYLENESIKKERRRRNRSTPIQKSKQNEYQKQRFADNVQLRVRNAFSVSIRTRLKGNKRDAVFTSVGYTLAELMNHLESQFTEGMSWDNYGSYWQIDHKTPDSWFKYESHDCEGFKKSWALSNLQPLSKAENMSKGARYAH